MFDVLTDRAERSPLKLIFGLVVLFICITMSFSVGFGVAILGATTFQAVEYIRHHRKFHGPDTWPLARATVESVDVKVVTEGTMGGRRYYLGELSYSYCAQGSYHSGFYRSRFSTEEAAWDFVNDLRGKEIPVRYKPEEAAISLMSDVEIRSVIGTAT